MLLSGKVKLDCGMLEYSFSTSRGTHFVKVTKGCTKDYRTHLVDTPGEAVSLLTPFRDERQEVRDLIEWLCDQCKLPVPGDARPK